MTINKASNFQQALVSWLTGADEELIRAFFRGEINGNELSDEFLFENYDYDESDIPGFDALGCVAELKDHHGGEGEGDQYWGVYSFTDDASNETVYIKFNGWYASYIGAEFEDFFVVKPVQKTITVYE